MKRWLEAIFYKPKHEKSTDENILRLLMPSVVGIFICMVCLAGSTWAWFSASVQTVAQTIEAANFDISAAVTDKGGVSVPSDRPLQAGQTYKVTLTASGTAPSGGYCKVEGGTDSLYTITLLPGDTLTFTLIPEKDAVYTFTAVWGKYSGGADITNNCVIGQEETDSSAETFAGISDPLSETSDISEYAAQSGDTLTKIAQEYGTTVENLAAYNEIDDPDHIEPGWTLRIPPEDYEIPSPPAVSGGKDEPAQQPAENEEPAEETPSEQANPVTENVSADDSPTVSQPADTPAATGSGDTEPAVPPASPESTEPTGSEPPEPDFSETDETNESQSTQAPAG